MNSGSFIFNTGNKISNKSSTYQHGCFKQVQSDNALKLTTSTTVNEMLLEPWSCPVTSEFIKEDQKHIF